MTASGSGQQVAGHRGGDVQVRVVRFARVGRMLCLTGAALGVSGLLGWGLGVPHLTTLIPGEPAMKANTALGLMLAGVGGALLFRVRANRLLRSLSAAAAAVVLAIAVCTLVEYALGIDLYVDQLLVAEHTGPYPGRPSPPTALALAFLAAALLLFDACPAARARPSEWCALAAGLVAFVAFLGLAFGAGPLYRLPGAAVSGVAIPTAVGVLLIAVGLLFERPGAGLMRVVVSPGPGGALLRRFVPTALLVPILLKLMVTSVFAGAGIHDLSLIYAVMIGAMSVSGVILLALTAPRLNRAHDALEMSRVRFSDLVERAPDGIFVADLEGRYQEVNDAACRMLGYARDELIGKTIVDLIPPEDVGRLWESQQQLLKGGTDVGEWSLRRKDGTPLPVEVSAAILPDGRWQAIVRDISERHRAQQLLREAQERVALALKGADLGTWDWNIQSGEVIFNSRWAEMRGFSPDEVKPDVRSWLSNMHPDDLPRVQRTLDDYFQGRVSDYEAEFRAKTKSGEWIWILDRGRIFSRDERGQPVRMAGTELDITPRKRAEEDLRLAEAKSSGILSVSADAIISIDRAQRITSFNAGAERIFGYSRLEVLGAPLDLLMPARFRAIHREHVERFAVGSVVARRMGERGSPISGLRKNGEEFPADAAISKLAVAGTEILTVAVRDITDQQRLEEELRRAIQSRDDVLGVVAHDLRNPLNSIVLQALILRRAGNEPERRSRRPAELIERAAKHMDRLIQDLLDVARIEAGQISLHLACLRTGQLLSDVLEANKPLASAASLELELDVAEELPDVLADRDRLFQVLDNVIGNARKFTEAGGRIRVGAAPRDGEVLFWVVDTGSGISAENVPHLFERFWQARKGERRGAGLGLPIVKGIVEAHGGRVWLETSPGKGSTFFFTVPTMPLTGEWPPPPTRRDDQDASPAR